MADRVGGGCCGHRLAGEARRVDVDVGREDNRVGAGDGVGIQRVQRTVGTLRLDVDLVPHQLGLAL